MLICSSNKRKHLASTGISPCLNNTVIQQVDNIDYLGLTLPNDLQFKEHFNNRVSKLNRANGVLQKLSPYVPMSTRKTLYDNIALPHVDYCSSVLSNLPKTYIVRLHIIGCAGQLACSSTED